MPHNYYEIGTKVYHMKLKNTSELHVTSHVVRYSLKKSFSTVLSCVTTLLIIRNLEDLRQVIGCQKCNVIGN